MGRAEEGQPEVVTTDLVVEGMHCPSCVALVHDELLERRGVTSATVDLDTGRASVVHDPAEADTAALLAAVEAAGYTAKAASPGC